jgi:GNAT superfamily N-acetyltransferase
MIQSSQTTDGTPISIREVSTRDLPELYAIYFDAFPRSHGEDGVPPDSPEGKTAKLTLIRAIAIHLLHVSLGRLTYAHDRADPWSVLSGRGDMKPFLIMRGSEPVGCCFLLRHTPEVWELGIIGVTSSMKKKGIGSKAVEEVKRYASSRGARRIVVRASGIRSATAFFLGCGFKKAYAETHLTLDLGDGRGNDHP